MTRTLALTCFAGLILVAKPAAAQDGWQCTEPAVAQWPVAGSVTERFPMPMPDVVATRTRVEAATALREGDAARALELYRRAALEDPGDTRASCGAALAAVRASRLRLAVQHAWLTERAFFASTLRPRERAACLYNAGLAYEAGGRPVAAHRVWTRSLELRRSAAVRRALRRLPASAHPPRRDAATWVRVADRVERWVCHSLGEDGPSCGEEGTQVATSVVAPLGQATDLDARLISVSVQSEGGMESIGRLVLVLRHGRSFSARQLYELDHSGSGEYVTLSIERFVVETSAGAPRLWLETRRASVSAHGDDRGGLITRHLHIGDRDADTARLRSLVVESSTFSEIFGRDDTIAYRRDSRVLTRTCIRNDQVRVESQRVEGGVDFETSDDVDQAPSDRRTVAPTGPPVTSERRLDELTSLRLFPLRR